MPYVVRILREGSSVSASLEVMIELCRTIRELNRTILSAHPRDQRSQMSKLRTTTDDLNRHLAKFQWSPQVSPYPGETPDLKVRYGFSTTTHDEQKENKAVEWVIRHIGEIDRIRRCQREACNRWFWAETNIKIFCSDDCRKTRHSQSPSAKKNRAEYMRQYRKDEKSRAERAKKLARGK